MKNIIIAVIVILLAGGVWFFVSGSDAEELEDDGALTTSQTLPGIEADEGVDMIVEGEDNDVVEALVSYIGEGFDPEILGPITVGTTVRFFNESSSEVWVASDNHPTHQVLPEFDSLAGIGTNEFYEFTFDEVGEWTYHNHLNSSQTGTIQVVAE